MEEWLTAHGQTVCLLLSYNCQAACRHCGYHCGPEKSPVISIDQGKQVIDCARQMPMVAGIGFAGGEVFLHYKLMRELFQYVKGTCGLPLALSTNAYWATTQERAREMLLPLVESGLGSMLVSVDDFHLEFVRQECIENCVNAAVELGAQCHLQAIVTRHSRKVGDFKGILKIPSDSPQIHWHENPCVPTGRAEDIALGDEIELSWRSQPDACTMLTTWIVNPYGQISPCCGMPFEGLRAIGNAYEQSLIEIASRANADPVLNALAAYGGPYLLIELLARRGLTTYARRNYAGNCHACQVVLSDAKAMALIQDELQEHALELIASRAILHEQLWGKHAIARNKVPWIPDLWFNRCPVADAPNQKSMAE
jgi:pyruvate-formate lyase-activating enzyme